MAYLTFAAAAFDVAAAAFAVAAAAFAVAAAASVVGASAAAADASAVVAAAADRSAVAVGPVMVIRPAVTEEHHPLESLMRHQLGLLRFAVASALLRAPVAVPAAAH